MAKTGYSDPSLIIQQLLNLAYFDFKGGLTYFDISEDDIVKLNGNPTYINQYRKMFQQRGFTITSFDFSNQSKDFRIDLSAEMFPARIKQDEEEEKRKQEELDLQNEHGHSFASHVTYSDTSEYFDSRDVTSKVGIIIAKLIKNAEYSPIVYVFQKDIAPYSTDDATMKMIQHTLATSGVKCYLENCRDLFESEDKQAIVIHWHNSDLYLGLQ